MIRSLSIALLLLLAVPASALAQSTQAPPGLSATDQYLETVPDSGGNSTVGRGGQAPSAADPSVAIKTAQSVPAETLRQLQREGRSGKAAAALAGSGAPTASLAPKSKAASSPPKVPLKESAPAGALAAIGSIATGAGSDGIGVWFPLLIVLGTIAVAGAAYWRRRAAT